MDDAGRAASWSSAAAMAIWGGTVMCTLFLRLGGQSHGTSLRGSAGEYLTLGVTIIKIGMRRTSIERRRSIWEGIPCPMRRASGAASG